MASTLPAPTSRGTASSNGIELYYETHGDPDDPALLLVNGFSSQILGWPDGLRETFAARGRYVISFDNRDVGLSTHLDGVAVDLSTVSRPAEGEEPTVPYTLSSFGDDAIGLLDHLDIAAAHIAGVSMGGMIVQQTAIDHPDRILSMTSIMSTSGEAAYFESAPEAMEALLLPSPTERDAFVEQTATSGMLWASKRYGDRDALAKRAGQAFDRMFYPEGLARQIAAIRGSHSRVDGLRSLTVPTLVIHGHDDTLILPSGGERTAELVPDSHLLMLADMGHDLPEPLWPVIAGAMVGHQDVAAARG
ncbi:MAG: alpha/beta fold hydrolase [Acidimicrobiales bacterium]